ncbi:MAG: amidohydrolase family protein, partial [Bacillota bacterium]
MEYVLRNAIVLTPLERLPGAHVAFSGGKLTGVGKGVCGGAPGVDLTGYAVAPGFIDVHVHGGGGYSLIDGDPRGLQGFRQWVLRTGVTSFLMSVMAATPEELVEAVKENKAEVGRGDGGACCLGFHLEGPFLSPRRPGAFDPSWFRLPDKSLMDEFLGAGEGTVRVVTVAPELPGAPELVQHVSRMGVLVALGHTDATYEDFMAGVRAGARHVTHCYNTMRGFGHRE